MNEKNRKEERENTLGWFAHVGNSCARCGGGLGPFTHRDCNVQEFWGCPSCGIGVFFGGEGQPDIDRAADMFMATMGRNR